MRHLLASGPRRVLFAAIFASAAALSALTTVTGCAPGPGAMTPQEIEAHGIMIVRAPPEKTFKACMEALKAVGYEIEVESPDKGLIITKRRSIMRDVPVTAKGPELSYSRQYTVQIKSAGGGASRVTATPAMFENATDVSRKPVWDLDSTLGEHELWKQLFAKIEQLL
jgi:hypothetical protein